MLIRLRTTAVLAGMCMLGGIALPAQGTVVTSYDFTGDSTDNWGWGAKSDANSQLSGTDQMTYTYLGSMASGLNAKGYVTHTITDAATVFPDGTGSITMRLRVDLSGYTTGSPEDYGGIPLMELGNVQGNKSQYLGLGGGYISKIGITGWKGPNQFRFNVANSIRFANGAAQTTSAINLGADPDFPLIYDLTLTTTVTGSPGAWVVETSGTATGPTKSDGTVGTITIPTAILNSTDANWGGLKHANAYRVGISGGGIGLTADDWVSFDNFAVDPIPEPTSFGLVGAGALLLGARRRRHA